MDAILVTMHADLGLPPEQARRVLGAKARERYSSGSATDDFPVAADQLAKAAKSTPPDKALATRALKRMRLDWETMSSGEGSALQGKATTSYDSYLMAFQARRPSQLAMAEDWKI